MFGDKTSLLVGTIGCHKDKLLEANTEASRVNPDLPEEEDLAVIPEDLPARPEHALDMQRPNEDLYIDLPSHSSGAWPEPLENGTPMKVGGTVLVELRNIIGLTNNAIDN